MGDGHDGSRELLQVLLQPGHALGVQVVGRLVEQQQIRPLQEHLAQGHPPPLAARQLVDVRIRRRQAQGIHGDLQRAIDIPALGRVDGVLQFGLLFQQLLHFVGRDVRAQAQR